MPARVVGVARGGDEGAARVVVLLFDHAPQRIVGVDGVPAAVGRLQRMAGFIVTVQADRECSIGMRMTPWEQLLVEWRHADYRRLRTPRMASPNGGCQLFTVSYSGHSTHHSRLIVAHSLNYGSA